jgi:hypothetical protein
MVWLQRHHLGDVFMSCYSEHVTIFILSWSVDVVGDYKDKEFGLVNASSCHLLCPSVIWSLPLAICSILLCNNYSSVVLHCSNYRSSSLLLSVMNSNVKSESNYITTDSQPAVCLGVRCLPGTCNQIFCFLYIIVKQLQVCGCGMLSLMRGRVCSLQFCWASQAQPFMGLSLMELITIFYCLSVETPQPAGPLSVQAL